MDDRVWMVHPDLPGQRIWVRPAAVAIHQASGWRLDEPEPASEPEPGGEVQDAIPDEVPNDVPEQESEPRRRRTTRSEGE